MISVLIDHSYEDDYFAISDIRNLFFESLKEIQLDSNGAKIENPFQEITSILAKLDLNHSKQWWGKNSF